VNFATAFTTVENGVSVGIMVIIMTASTALLGLILLYTWPLTIDKDPDNPLPCYYIFTCHWWRGGYNNQGAI